MIMLPAFFTWCSCISAILAVYVFSGSVSASNSSCPTWFYFNTTQQCVCGHEAGGVSCNQQEQTVQIRDGACMTFSGEDGLYYTASCPFIHTENKTGILYSELPADPDKLNSFMCTSYNRQGLLCGECIDGYGPAVYSKDMRCERCSRHSMVYGISLFLFNELILNTLLFVCVIIFRVDITAGPLLGYMLFCQVWGEFTRLQRQIFLCINRSFMSSPLFRISTTLCSLWNLKYFSFMIPPFCISSTLSDIHIHILHMVMLFYPIILLITTLVLCELHARNCRVIRILCKPFGIILNKTCIRTVTSDAVIRAFATLLIFSATTYSYDLYILIGKVPVYSSISGSIYKETLFFDSTVVFLSKSHILYLLVAIIPGVLLILVPSLLLCVYPTRIYGFFSGFISSRKRLAIRAFAEALHNCFKDGLNGTRDYRVLAGFVILSCPIFGTTTYIVQKIFSSLTRQFTTGLLSVTFSLLVSYVRPCKLKIANVSLSFSFLATGIIFIFISYSTWDISIAEGITEGPTYTDLRIILPLIYHILVFLWVGYTLSCHLWKWSGCPPSCKIRMAKRARVLKGYFHQRRNGYQELPATAR